MIIVLPIPHRERKWVERGESSVTQRNRFSAPAPSSSADSYRCLGTSSSDARKMIIVLPIPHSASSTSAGFDHDGELNQSGPSIPTLPSSVFTGPVAGFSRNTKPSVAATGGASVGR